MIAVVGIGKAHGERTLFEGVTLSLNSGSRYGLVGANGSGKSTFLRMLAGDEPATDGQINIPKRARVGVLRQDQFLDENARILDLAMMGDDVVWAALEEQRALLAGDGSGDGGSRVVELEERIRLHDGYTLEARAARVLEGLGIPVAIQGQALRTLSGGFRLRVLLAQVLVGRPEVLLLDEPTNHLDILSIRWLEKFLVDYTGCAVVVSHDQRFLENFVTHVLDVDYETITEYTGGYQAFLVAKQTEHVRRAAEIARVQKEIADKKAFVERFRAKATKARQAQSRLKQIEKIEIPELTLSSRQSPRFKFVPARPSGKDVLVVSEVSKAFGDKRVLTNVSLAVRRGERVAIIGPNGVGKSTLLKIVVGRLAPDTGAARWGHETRVGYFAQEHREVLTEPSATALEVMAAASPAATNSQVRGALGAVLFSGDDVHKRVGKLSGGEAARLVFALLSSQQPNVLVLDEPTNHLDIEAIDALAEAVIAFEGTVLFVSHDRWLVSRIATRVVEVREEGLRDFVGTYEEYLERCGDDHLDAEAVVLRAKQAKRSKAAEVTDAKGNGGTEATVASGTEAKPAVQASWEEQKRLRNRRKELPKRRDQIMAAIEEAEARKKELSAIYLDPQFYMKTGADEMARIEREEKAIEKTLAKLMAEWESIERELEQAAAEGPPSD